jgi:transcriptional regulator with XRE-family HTH domain
MTYHAELSAHLGRRIKELRHQAGFTQEGLARAAGCAVSRIQQLEAGRSGPRPTNPTLELFAELAVALQVEPCELLAPATGANYPVRPMPTAESEEQNGLGAAVVRQAIQDLVTDGAWHERSAVRLRAARAVPPGEGGRKLAAEVKQTRRQVDRQIAPGSEAIADEVIEEELRRGSLQQRGKNIRRRAL